MVNEVNKLILNTLVEQGAVYIPNIGTLSIYRTASRKRGSRIVAPSYSVTLSRECKASSLRDVIMTIANVDEASAEDIVTRWYAKVSAEGRVVIDGIGNITNEYFSPDSELIAKLNRNNTIIALTTKRGNRKRWWLVPLIILAITSLGLSLYNLINREQTTMSTNTLAIENIEAENQNISTEIDSATPTEETVVTEQLDEPATEAEITIEEVIESPESKQEPTTDVVEHEEPQPVTEITDWREQRARHYVIFGSYSTATNANVAVRKILRSNPAAQCQVIRIGSLHAVAVFGSNNHSDCVVFKRQNRALYKDAWIHSPKN